MAEDMYKKKQTIIKRQLTCFQTYLKKFDGNPNRLIELQVRLEKIESLLSEFIEAQIHLELAAEKDESLTTEHEKFENSFYETIAYARNIVNSMTSKVGTSQDTAITNGQGSTQQSSSATNNTIPAVKVPDIKLPDIKLPTFNGDYGRWMSFRDTFEDLIDKNSNLSDTRKLHYLKSSVTDVAAQVIQSIEITDANYRVAWELLRKRFENERLIIHHHVQSILDLTNVVKESSASLRRFIDDTQQHLRILKKLNQPTDKWDTLLIHILTPKLDFATKREWEFKRETSTLPTLTEFLEFLAKRCTIFENLSSSTFRSGSVKEIQKMNDNRVSTKRSMSLVSRETSNNKLKCPFCKNSHLLYACQMFRDLPIHERTNEVRKMKICSNCLRSHPSRECSLGGCKRCQGRHNTLLHRDNVESTTNFNAKNKNEFISQSVNEETSNQSQRTRPFDVSATTSCCSTRARQQVLLSTAIVTIFDNQDRPCECRVLLDSASQMHFITRELCARLQLVESSSQQTINGIGQTDTKARGTVTATVQSKYNRRKFELHCLILDTITDSLPQTPIDTCKFKIPAGIQLADPTYDIPGKIDLLVGASTFYDLLCDGRMSLGKNQPVLQNTHLGWIIGGVFTPCSPTPVTNSLRCHLSTDASLHDQLDRFWRIEEITATTLRTVEEQYCEDHFSRTHTRNNDGRFTVSLPLLESPSVLGDSIEIARKRLSSVDKRLQRDAELKSLYNSFMTEYQQLGHMEVAEDNQNKILPVQYLPHHPVVKHSNNTTKIRVVFDASAKTASGKSLNSILAVGPVIQDDLFSIVLRFREHRYVLSADVIKMYRQILMDPSQRDLQRILWKSESEEVCEFVLNTVTYGMSSSPYLAIRCLHQIAMDHEYSHPEASNVIKRDFYVDDLLTGANDLSHLANLKEDIKEVLASAKFELSKWSSNEPSLIHLATEQDTKISVNIGDEVKTLGLVWDTRQDSFRYKSNISKPFAIVTKRYILSTISQIFDPLGLVGPITIKAKILMQHLWTRKSEWDEEIPPDLCNTWNVYFSQLQDLPDITIPRWILCENFVRIELHCFSDASEAAYGACIYVRASDDAGSHVTKLLCAKSKVAPLKNISLPRLELCAALLTARLYQKITEACTTSFSNAHFWTDSTITLAWIKGEPTKWVTFVANRVAEIQRITDKHTWRHVRSENNPADVISRGSNPNELRHNTLWWNGPKFLQGNDIPFDYDILIPSDDHLPDRRKIVKAFTTTVQNDDLCSRFSTLNKLKRTIAYCLRFIKNARNPILRSTGSLSVDELDSAMKVLLRIMQSQAFATELSDLDRCQEVHRTSKLRALHPFVDNVKLIRVGGRLSQASIPYSKKFPIVLPAKHKLTYLIIFDMHHRLLHAGPQALLAAVREHYWPLAGRRTIRSVLRHCLTCFRARPANIEQLMGDLPASRVTQTRPFASTGIDYAGPFNIKISRNKSGKAYLCLFVCLVTKAIHLEIASDLSTEAFLRAFKRFIARRGKSITIYSDNGKNFVGAKRELRDLEQLVISNDHQTKVKDYLSYQSIKWICIPPYSPHVGGLWEAAVKSAKTHIRKVIGNSLLNFEELYTVFTQVEACLNSRPLYPMSNDPSDLNVLTPGHFLIGTSLTAIPEESLIDVQINRLTRYQLLIRIQQDFWRRWHREYLSQLQERNKWKKISNNQLSIGMLVLLKEDNIPPLQWRLGRIVKTYLGKDKLIRVVDVRTATGVLQRTIPKICILPIPRASDI